MCHDDLQLLFLSESEHRFRCKIDAEQPSGKATRDIFPPHASVFSAATYRLPE